MAKIDSVALAEDQKQLRVPVSALSFVCKCGCELFTVDWETYADCTGGPVLSCFACRQICTPTEPVTNGPH